MITKFKIFENENKYKIGDYVYVVQPSIYRNQKYYRANVKIIDMEFVESLDIYQYLVDDAMTEDKEIGKTGSIISGNRYVLERDIKRHLTPEEIEDWKIKKISKKYNI